MSSAIFSDDACMCVPRGLYTRSRYLILNECHRALLLCVSGVSLVCLGALTLKGCRRALLSNCGWCGADADVSRCSSERTVVLRQVQ